MYTIKQAAAMTGLRADTIRAWERRYHLPSPQRSEGGYRLYDDAALAIYRSMHDLVAQGWRPRQAARHALAARDLNQPVPSPQEFATAVAQGRMAGAELAATLRTAFRSGPIAEVLDGWLVPTTEELGRAWADGRLAIAQEHEVAAGLMHRLAILFADGESRSGRPPILVGLMPGCRHEVVLFAFAVLARLSGLQVCYLGADVPVESWLGESRSRRPAALVTAVHDDADVAACRELVAALAGRRKRPLVLVGGRRQDEVALGAEALGHVLADGLQRLRAALAALPDEARPGVTGGVAVS